MSHHFLFSDSALLQQLSTIINASITTDAIYCFGQRKNIQQPHNSTDTIQKEHHHFYLFVLAPKYKVNTAANLMDILNNKTGGRLTATLLLHKTSALKKCRGNQSHFFYQILQFGQPIYINIESPPQMSSDAVQQPDIESIHKFVSDRQKTALYFLEQAEKAGVNQIKAFMLHQATEQACLGLIRLFLIYRPDHYALGFLLDLCDLFSPLTANIIPRETEEDIKLFRLLSTHPFMLRQGYVDNIIDTDIGILYNRCSHFITTAISLFQIELQSLSRSQTATIEKS